MAENGKNCLAILTIFCFCRTDDKVAPLRDETLSQFTKVWQHFRKLKTKPSKGFQNIKWRSHFMFWYYELGKFILYKYLRSVYDLCFTVKFLKQYKAILFI
jgi:uncharacterized membrane protein